MKRSPVVCLLLVSLLSAQAQSQNPAPSQMPSVTTYPEAERWHGLLRPYVPRRISPTNFENSPRIRELIRAGNLYLSLRDAIALAIENNLDIELGRFTIPMAEAELLRARGGGLPRGISYTLQQPPAGVGGPQSQLVTQAATSATPGTTVASNALELGVLGEPQTNLSVLGLVPLSNGTPIPAFDPSLFANYNWQHQTILNANLTTSGTGALVNTTNTGNAGYQQGFALGTQVSATFSNTETFSNSPRNVFNPFISSDIGLTVTQPLLRGFGRELNRRFIRIAANEGRITGLLFQQQLIEVVYGVVRLYTDLAALSEDAKVKAETLASAEKLLSDIKAQVDEGTVAPLELARARAQVSGTRQDLIVARGLVEEQEAILKTVLTRRGAEDPEVRSAHVIPTESLTVPAEDAIKPIEDLFTQAYRMRPDLGQAGVQVENSEISLKGSRSNLRPQLDLVGVAQNNGLAGDPALAGADPRFAGGYGNVLSQIATRQNPTYGIGIQLTLPLRNRVAQADAVRDELQLRQSQVRERQLRNQVQLEVEDALIAMRRARASFEAAAETRSLQEQSLEFEQIRFNEGVSTAFFVIQYQSLLAQARSAEVAAKSAYLKARAALERAVGSILDSNGVTLDAARNGHM